MASQATLYCTSKQGEETSTNEVPCVRESLNQQDAFVLDAGAKIYVWCGEKASPFEKNAANMFAENKESEQVVEDAVATHDIDDNFWELLGGKGPISEKGTTDATSEAPLQAAFESVLYHVAKKEKQEGETEVKVVPLKRESLNQRDAFVLDSGDRIYIWCGKRCSPFEKNAANMLAENKESERGSDDTKVTHDVDDRFWELLGGKGPIPDPEESKPARPAIREPEVSKPARPVHAMDVANAAGPQSGQAGGCAERCTTCVVM